MKSIKDIGTALRQARKKNGMSIDDVHKKTHIHPDAIKALEEGNIAHFSSTRYAKGFLKQYLNVLGLDEEAILSDFKKYVPETDKQKLYLDSELETEIEYGLYVKIVVAVIAVTLIIFSVVFVFSKISTGIRSVRARSEAIRSEKAANDKKADLSVVKTASKISLRLNAKDKVWLSVKKDDRTVFEGMLKKGDVEQWDNGKSYDLRAGKLEALNFTINDKPMGKIGKGVKDVQLYIDKNLVKMKIE